MKFLKPYNIFLELIDSVKDIINSTNTDNYMWNVNTNGVKVFFDITSYDDPTQTPYGKLLIIANTMRDLKDRFQNDYWYNMMVCCNTYRFYIF